MVMWSIAWWCLCSLGEACLQVKIQTHHLWNRFYSEMHCSDFLGDLMATRAALWEPTTWKAFLRRKWCVTEDNSEFKRLPYSCCSDCTSKNQSRLGTTPRQGLLQVRGKVELLNHTTWHLLLDYLLLSLYFFPVSRSLSIPFLRKRGR